MRIGHGLWEPFHALVFDGIPAHSGAACSLTTTRSPVRRASGTSIGPSCRAQHCPRDAAQAFRCVCDANSNHPWFSRPSGLIRVAAPVPNPKYLFGQASGMGYRPKHGFNANFTSSRQD
jgi:hypothetical protein